MMRCWGYDWERSEAWCSLLCKRPDSHRTSLPLSITCCRYVSADKQAMFTGKQQRDGVPVLPFIMAGLFRVESRAGARVHSADVRSARNVVTSRELILDMDDNSGDDGDGEYDADEEAAKVDKSFKFDWVRYHAVWGDTPIEKAIVEVFAEYATLYARMSGQVRSCVPPPMTLSTGLSIAEQASRFVVKYVTPVLGEIASTKMHRLLCHVMDAINWHGDLQNGNTAENESTHKHDKMFYGRTNKHLADFTRQLVMYARGSQAILAKLDAEDARCAEDGASSAGDEAGGSGEVDGDRGSSEGGRRAPKEASLHHLRQVTVAELAALPDLAHVGSLLGKSENATVAVMATKKIRAIMDCGTPNVQLVRAAESFYKGPWHDAVLYRANADSDVLSVGELRAIVRLPVGDVAVLCEMEPVAPVQGCPFARRGCTRLAWRVAPTARRIALRVVPVASIRRLVFVVPDFDDLTARCGPFALPPGRNGDLEARLAMRFFINDFYAWEMTKE